MLSAVVILVEGDEREGKRTDKRSRQAVLGTHTVDTFI